MTKGGAVMRRTWIALGVMLPLSACHGGDTHAARTSSATASPVATSSIATSNTVTGSPVPTECSDGPTDAEVQDALGHAPPTNTTSGWRVETSGSTTNCQFYWVELIGGGVGDSPEIILFFNKHTWVGNSTPDARPYLTVVGNKDDTIVLKYQWRAAGDPGCCPSQQTTVRYRMTPDGNVRALDAIPPAPRA